jgi:hypothetical protein
LEVVKYVHDVMEQNEVVVMMDDDEEEEMKEDHVDDHVAMDYDDDDVEVIEIEIGNDVFFYVKMTMIDYE